MRSTEPIILVTATEDVLSGMLLADLACERAGLFEVWRLRLEPNEVSVRGELVGAFDGNL